MTVVDMKAAKAAAERKRHADRVLRAFDGLKHAATREQLARRAEVERKARNKT